MLKKGKSIEDLYSTLEALGTKSQTILTANRKDINITLTYTDKELDNWKLETKSSDLIPKKKLCGKKYDGFLNALGTLYEKGELFQADSSDSILCYRDTQLKRTNGKIISNWFEIDPGFPFVISMDGQPKFKIRRLELTEWEYQRMMETQLAFLHEDKYYPFTKGSLHSIGSRLDCSAAFKYQDDCQLGPALLIAEKFSRCRGLKVQYRKCTEKVFPVLSVSGNDFIHIPLVDFFQKAISHIPGIYTPVKWSVNDLYATIDLAIQGYENNQMIRIEAGDLPGRSISVSAIVVIEGYDIPLKTNKKLHNGKIDDSIYETLFDGIIPAFNSYEEELKNNPIIPCPNLKEIKRCIGLKRAKMINLSQFESKDWKRWDLIQKLIRLTNFELSEKQQNDLRKLYSSMILGEN